MRKRKIKRMMGKKLKRVKLWMMGNRGVD